MGIFSWLNKKPYRSCTASEMEYIQRQVHDIVGRCEQTALHMFIPNRHLLGIRLADATPVDVTIADFVDITTKNRYITRNFIVSPGTNSYGDYIIYFVCGGGGGGASNTSATEHEVHEANEANEVAIEYTEL